MAVATTSIVAMPTDWTKPLCARRRSATATWTITAATAAAATDSGNIDQPGFRPLATLPSSASAQPSPAYQ